MRRSTRSFRSSRAFRPHLRQVYDTALFKEKERGFSLKAAARGGKRNIISPVAEFSCMSAPRGFSSETRRKVLGNEGKSAAVSWDSEREL